MGEADPRPESERYTPPPQALLGGKYQAVSPVGRGGMASVWLGYTHGEAGFRRKVAIKRVLRHLHSDERFEAMFVEEARVVSDLNHPNIVQVHDFGREAEGGYFIIMEWVDGISLADYVKAHARANKQVEWPIACAICIEVLRALSAAHSRTEASGRPVPVIHRDVTPSNILVGSNGVIKLADFGLARAMDRPRMTDPGIVKGKVAYLSPELLENAKPDPRCDLYSLGVVLWEALAGKRLFGTERTEIDTALRILQGNIEPVSEARSELPHELIAIVTQATARSPRDRFQRATDMIEALSGLLRRQPSATDATAIARSVRAAKAWGSSTHPPPAGTHPPPAGTRPPPPGALPDIADDEERAIRTAQPPPPPTMSPKADPAAPPPIITIPSGEVQPLPDSHEPAPSEPESPPADS
jgi:serine/threonine-protein kinase